MNNKEKNAYLKDLAQKQWQLIKPHLPEEKIRGG